MGNMTNVYSIKFLQYSPAFLDYNFAPSSYFDKLEGETIDLRPSFSSELFDDSGYQYFTLIYVLYSKAFQLGVFFIGLSSIVGILYSLEFHNVKCCSKRNPKI